MAYAVGDDKSLDNDRIFQFIIVKANPDRVSDRHYLAPLKLMFAIRK